MGKRWQEGPKRERHSRYLRCIAAPSRQKHLRKGWSTSTEATSRRALNALRNPNYPNACCVCALCEDGVDVVVGRVEVSLLLAQRAARPRREVAGVGE
eukprot:6174171-Pleurochrysis_carterae.AAC.2